MNEENVTQVMVSGITRMVEGQVNRIELEDKEYIDNIQAHDMNSTVEVDRLFQ